MATHSSPNPTQKLDIAEDYIKAKAVDPEEDSLYGRTPLIDHKKQPATLDSHAPLPPPKFDIPALTRDGAPSSERKNENEVAQQSNTKPTALLATQAVFTTGTKESGPHDLGYKDSPPLGEIGSSDDDEDEQRFHHVKKSQAGTPSRAKINRHIRVPDDYRYIEPADAGDSESKSTHQEKFHDISEGVSGITTMQPWVSISNHKRKSIQKTPESTVEEVTDDMNDVGTVEIARIGRIHNSLKRKADSSPPRGNLLSSSALARDLQMTGAGDSAKLTLTSPTTKEEQIEQIILAPKTGRDQADSREDYHIRVLGKHEAHPEADYHLEVKDKDQVKSHEKFELRIERKDSTKESFSQRSPSTLPEVVPPMSGKMMVLPLDDKIPLPRHDEKIPDDRSQRPDLEKELSPHGYAVPITPPETRNQADEKVLPIYIDPEGGIPGGEYFVGKPNDLTGRQSIDGQPPLKVAVDGTILIPQPSDNKNDPLNWSWLKKNTTFWALLVASLLSDLVIYYDLPLLYDQAYEWDRSVKQVQGSTAAALAMQAVGALATVPFAQRFGRLPVLFWSQLLTMIATVATTYTQPYGGFAFFRTMQGLFGIAPQVIGLSICHDIFFFHERARKINFWLCFTFFGPSFGAFLSGLIVQRLQWRDTFAVVCGLYGFSVLLVILIADETLFDASNPWPKAGGAMERILLLSGFVGAIQSHGRPTVWQGCKHVFTVIIRPYIFLPSKYHFKFSYFQTSRLLTNSQPFFLSAVSQRQQSAS